MAEVTVHALTRRFNGIARVITSPVEIHNTITAQKESTEAIWDTGATNSSITKALAAKLGLIAVTQAKITGVHGVKEVNVYPIRITLNSQVGFTLPVSECDALSSDGKSGFLLGMDIISRGDFAVSNLNGKTVMTFRTPSIEQFDFVASTQAIQKSQEVKKSNEAYLKRLKRR